MERRSECPTKSKANCPFTQSDPSLAGPSMAGSTPTTLSPRDITSTEQPTPQYGQIVRVVSVSPGTSRLASALRSPSAPVGQVWMHCPQKVHAESLSRPPNSVVIRVWKPRFMIEIA